LPEEQALAANERIYATLLSQLGASDLGELAARKELSLKSGGVVEVLSFGRLYHASQGGVVKADGGEAGFKERFAIVNYLLSEGSGEPSGEFIPFGSLGGFNIGRQRHEDRSLKGPILARFADDYPALAAAAESIGGVEERGDSSSEHRWRFSVFPQLPISLTFYERDMDFPPDATILFDSRALDFLGLSCLGFLPDYFTSTLLEAAAEH